MKTPKVNVGFVCAKCGHEVPPHPTSSRDHCNSCLFSKHVDVVPGDRKSGCKGDLEPVGLLTKGGRQQIVYRCLCCGGSARCVAAADDSRDRLIELSTNPVPYEMLPVSGVEGRERRPARAALSGRRM